jgi:hypothetical protein
MPDKMTLGQWEFSPMKLAFELLLEGSFILVDLDVGVFCGVEFF